MIASTAKPIPSPRGISLLVARLASLSGADKTFLAGMLLFLGTILVFVPVAHYEFISYDDPGYVYLNTHVVGEISWENTKWAFTALNAGISYWHPLTWMSHQLHCQLFGINPGTHHFTSVIIHAANGVLLMLLLLRATGQLGCAFLVAALFAIHPLHVESVAWISERKEVLSTFFALLAMIAYVRYARPELFSQGKDSPSPQPSQTACTARAHCHLKMQNSTSSPSDCLPAPSCANP